MSDGVGFPVTAGGPTPQDGQQADSSWHWGWSVLGFVVGVVGVLGLLSLSEDLGFVTHRVGYVPGMFLFVVAMMVFGGLLAGSFLSLWEKFTG